MQERCFPHRSFELREEVSKRLFIIPDVRAIQWTASGIVVIPLEAKERPILQQHANIRLDRRHLTRDRIEHVRWER